MPNTILGVRDIKANKTDRSPYSQGAPAGGGRGKIGNKQIKQRIFKTWWWGGDKGIEMYGFLSEAIKTF